MWFKRIVGVVQIAAAGFALATVVLLFTRQPPTKATPAPVAAASQGATVFASRCASCHGAGGEGASAPALKGVATRYPDVADEIAVVTAGKGAMAAFGATLTPEEIAAVVEHTRTKL